MRPRTLHEDVVAPVRILVALLAAVLAAGGSALAQPADEPPLVFVSALAWREIPSSPDTSSTSSWRP